MKIGIIRCQEHSNDYAGYHCFPAIREKKGKHFRDYDTIELVGFDTCGGCGRNTAEKIVARALKLKEHGAEVIHLGECMIYACPFKELYEEELKEKVGLPIIKGTHGVRRPPHKINYPPSWVLTPRKGSEQGTPDSDKSNKKTTKRHDTKL